MERIVRSDTLVRIEVEPILVSAIPAHGQALEPASWKLDQILLQGIDAEDIVDSEVGQLTVRTFGIDIELIFLLEEAGCHSKMGKRGVGEVSQHGLGSCLLHRQVMMRALPLLVLVCVAVPAETTIDEADFWFYRLGHCFGRLLFSCTPDKCHCYQRDCEG